MVEAVPNHPKIWSDDSMEPIPHLDVEVAEDLLFLFLITIMETCSGFRWVVTGHMQTVILARQAFSGVQLGIRNLNVLMFLEEWPP